MNQLFVTFEESATPTDGVRLDALITALDGVQDAVRLMVQHLGDRRPGPGQPPRWVQDQSSLRLKSTREGSFIAELALDQPPSGQQYLENYGEQAIDAFLDWDGDEDTQLPSEVASRLCGITTALPEGMRLWLGSTDDHQKVEVKRQPLPATDGRDYQEALLFGWLREVNWHRGSAQLHRYAGGYVSLRFGPSLSDQMLRLATRHVEVRGRGRFNRDDEWTSVEVETVSGARSWREPFDLEQFLNDPNPKVFKPEEVVQLDLTEDEFEEFLRTIREGRGT